MGAKKAPAAKPEQTLTLPLAALTLEEIQLQASDFVNKAALHYPADELYVYIRQLHAAAEAALGELKVPAVEAFGSRMQGVRSGVVLGHTVELRAQGEWDYGPDVAKLKAEHKLEMDVAKAEAKRDGVAVRHEKEPTIAITLR